MVLDANPKETKFYDYKFIDMDSLTKRNPGHNFRTDSPSGQILKRAKNSFSNTAFFTNNKGDYFSVESNDEMKWKISKDIKTRDGYKLQKATMDFGGRRWTAWYAPEIPALEGPYKFRGLPGLIFEVKDADKNFVYNLVKNKRLSETFDTSNFLETYYGTKPIAINHMQYIKLKMDDYNDPVANLVNVIKNGGKVNMNGEVLPL